MVSHSCLSSHSHFSVVPESHLSFSQRSVVAVCAFALLRFVSISELPFSELSLATPLLLSSSLFFSLSPLTFLAVVSVAVSAAISESAVFSVSVAAAISAFVVLCLSAALFLLVVLLLLSAAVSVVLLHFLLAVSLFAVVLLHFLLPVLLRSGAMFGAERSGVLVLIALWEPLPVRRAARSGAMFGAERSGAMFGAERSSFLCSFWSRGFLPAMSRVCLCCLSPACLVLCS